MNKEEWIKDLTNLLQQRHNLDGAINYITSKIREINQKELHNQLIEKQKLKKKDE